MNEVSKTTMFVDFLSSPLQLHQTSCPRRIGGSSSPNIVRKATLSFTWLLALSINGVYAHPKSVKTRSLAALSSLSSRVTVIKLSKSLGGPWKACRGGVSLSSAFQCPYQKRYFHRKSFYPSTMEAWMPQPQRQGSESHRQRHRRLRSCLLKQSSANSENSNKWTATSLSATDPTSSSAGTSFSDTNEVIPENDSKQKGINDRSLEAVDKEFVQIDKPTQSKRKRGKPKRRPNRPGFNSYLKVVLDDESLSKLRSMTLNIQDQVMKNNEQKEETTLQTLPETTPRISDQTGSQPAKKQRPLTIKPRSAESLHMTFFFGGEVLCDIPAEELVDFHEKVATLLASKGFVLGETNEQSKDVDATFVIKELVTFPPRRHNLIVALLEAPPLFVELHDTIRSIAQTGPSEALRDITSYSKERWTPHVTLANIYGGSKTDLGRLKELLKEVTQQQTSQSGLKETGSDQGSIMLEAQATCVGIGGPVPQQVELDWTFYLPRG